MRLLFLVLIKNLSMLNITNIYESVTRKRLIKID